MAKQRKSLGRGLSNLLAGTEEITSTPQSHPNYSEISIENIEVNPDQPRKRFEEKELSELAETIKSVGLIEPVILRRLRKDKYQLIAGERRFRAAQMVGFKKIPAILKRVDDLQSLEIEIIENIQRESLNPVEEARAYGQWMQATNQKLDVLARKVGKDRTTVRNLIRILKLPREVLELVETKQLTVGQVRPLLNINNPHLLKQLALKIMRMQWSARRVEEEVGNLTESQVYKKSQRRRDANIAHLENSLRKALSARVQVEHKKNGKGKVTIYYGNLKDLDRLLELIGAKS